MFKFNLNNVAVNKETNNWNRSFKIKKKNTTRSLFYFLILRISAVIHIDSSSQQEILGYAKNCSKILLSLHDTISLWKGPPRICILKGLIINTNLKYILEFQEQSDELEAFHKFLVEMDYEDEISHRNATYWSILNAITYRHSFKRIVLNILFIMLGMCHYYHKTAIISTLAMNFTANR